VKEAQKSLHEHLPRRIGVQRSTRIGAIGLGLCSPDEYGTIICAFGEGLCPLNGKRDGNMAIEMAEVKKNADWLYASLDLHMFTQQRKM
jgi:hypothetical protein